MYLYHRITIILVALLSAASSASADSVNVTETWKDSTAANGVMTTKCTGTLTASLTIPGLSAATATDWQGLAISQLMTPYQGSQFTTDVMGDAPNTGGTVTANSATFFFQGFDTLGSFVNVEKIVFTRSGNTLTIVDTMLNPATWQPPSSLLAAYYLNVDGPISDTQNYDVTVAGPLSTGDTLNVDVSADLTVTGQNTVTSDSFGGVLNNVSVSATATVTVPSLPTVTSVSPASSTTTTNGLLAVSVKAASTKGVAEVDFSWNANDFGTGSSTSANVWAQLFALAPGANTFQTVAVDVDGKFSSPNTITVTYNNRATNAPSVQFNERALDSTQSDGSSSTFAFTQDAAVLTAAFTVPGLGAMPLTTWTNLHLALAFGHLNFSNRLGAASVKTSTSVTFNTTDLGDTVPVEQLIVSRQGDVLLIFKRAGNPAYANATHAILADVYHGTAGAVHDQRPFSLTLLDGITLVPYLSVAKTVYVNGSVGISHDSNNHEIDDIQVTGAADYAGPVTTITAPTANQQWSNSVFTIRGTATDLALVTNVFYSLNNGDWIQATPTNNSFTNWTALVNLTPGTNTIAAYALDSNGNIGATNKVNFVYILSAPLSVNIVGLGTASPNYNNALLQLGKNFSMTATAGSGFRFNGWTGSIVTNGATLVFTMASNLVFTANFVDTNRPTVAITSPTANQQVSNSVFTVRGTATDNVLVTNVYYSLNGLGWTPATPTNNSYTNWLAPVNLTPGTNSIAAYSVDSNGNVSPTNKVNFVYILSAPLTVNVVGLGTVSPNYNNALLQLGKNFSMTATAGSGFRFNGWTGSIVTNGATLVFTMASNLVFTANFVDTNRPTVAITSPTANQQVSNSVFTVRGTATDNVLVTNVYYSLNGSEWTPATPTNNNYTNWLAPVNLTPGTNSIAVYSVDSSGNVSPTNKVNFVYILSAPLSVNIVGLGTVSPNYNNALLQLGKNFSMTATATSGFRFVGWTGSIVTNGATLVFTMASNLVFTANFVDTNRPTITITAPTANQQWSNSLFILAGKATDNVLVTNVYYSLNNTDWISADPTNGSYTNWTAHVTLTPGTNAVAAYSVDSSGNVSPTNKVSFVYILSAPLTVNRAGLGNITPNYNGVLLALGKNFSMTATGTNGFKFTGWTGSLTTNGATLIFTMASNLVFTANFADTNRPTISITNLVAGQRVSNAVFTVAGTARDNWLVSNVFYQVNGMGWSNAVSANNGTNWTAALNLVPGTNNLQAYAEDTSGNVSTTNSLKFVYVVSALLQIQTTGLGKLSPNYSNAMLAVGQNYSITSSPAAGFIFTNWIVSTNWIGGAIVSKTNLQFMMVSNLTLQANFVDVAKPTLTITTPTANQKMPSAVANVTGTAADNWRVAGVWYQLNGGAWSAALTTNNWTNWNQTVPLILGTNTVKAYALDLGGNFSTTNSVSVVSSNTFVLQLVLNSVNPVSPTGLAFSLQLSTNLTGHIQYSTNLLDWLNLTNFNGTNSTLNFRDPAATNMPGRFYRAAIP